ncbi:MAG TPA: hypothetical protein VMG12_44755 [Polyangiaceae bacterium]|nr:hypothetical protein [Polyangiaceae bacterium]
MTVRFSRSGARRYAVIVTVAGEPVRTMDPAPAYDDDIPHDLVHYLVEAELGLMEGVFGRAARGGGTFIPTAEPGASPKERARQQRKQRRRERGFDARDARQAADLSESERLAQLCDVAWRRKHGQRPDPLRSAPVLLDEDAAAVERVVARLDAVAPLWRALPVGHELVFDWPSAVPSGANRAIVQPREG